MIIRAEDLVPEGVQIALPLEIEPLRFDADEAIRVEGLVITGRVAPCRGGLSFRGRLTGRAELACARCLRSFTMDLDRSFDVTYSLKAPSVKDYQIPDEDLDCAFLEEGGVLDLRQVATEQIYLELPMKPLCSPGCRGLCARCGGDLNTGTCRCEEIRPTY